MHRSWSRAIVVLLVGVAVGASTLSALLPPEEIPAYPDSSAVALSNALVYGAWIATFVGAVGAVVLVGRRPQQAVNVLSAGLYTLAVGGAFVAYGLSAFGGSDAGMGPVFLGGPLLLLSAIVAVVRGVAVLGHRAGPLGRALGAAGIGAVLTIGWLLLRGPQDWQGAISLTRLHGAPLVLAVGVLSVALVLLDPTPPPRRR
jgi:hypothetical protein